MTLRAKPVASADGCQRCSHTGTNGPLRGQDPRFLGGELFLSQQTLGFHLAKFLTNGAAR
jgi:hypothetical protein